MRLLYKTKSLTMNMRFPLNKWHGWKLSCQQMISQNAFGQSLSLLCLAFLFCNFHWFPNNGINNFDYLKTKDNSLVINLMEVEAGLDVSTCLGDSVQLFATGTATYQWSPPNGLSCINCSNPKAAPDLTTLYFVTGDDGMGNLSTDSVLVTVNPPPQIDSVLFEDLTNCNEMNGSIDLFASDGTGSLEYSINGGVDWVSASNFENLGPGIYQIGVRNDDGTCEIFGDTVNLFAPDAPEILDVLVNQPTMCDFPDGIIVVSVTGGTGVYEFSNDGGITWQNLNTFQFIPSGLYQILVRNADGTCEVSGGTVNLQAAPGEPNITEVFSANPTDCSTDNGLITIVVSNASANFEYSIDGGMTWQADNDFTNLSIGTYEVRARRTDQTCMVTGGTVILEDPDTPVISGVGLFDPTFCGVEDGTIVIQQDGGGAFIEYSIDGGMTWQGLNTFGNLAAGNYTLAVRTAGSNCISVGETVTLQLPPNTPVINNAQLFNPDDCASANGSIIIAASACPGETLEYSIDGGDNWQSSNAFGGLAGGDYELAVRNQGSMDGVLGDTVTLAQPLPPLINDIETMQPACGLNNGAITIIATGNNGNLEYSIDGGQTWQSSNLFENLLPNQYEILARFPNSGCMTAMEVINLMPTDGPVIDNIEVFPDCDGSGGSMIITASGVNPLEYSIDGGGTWQASNAFPNLSIGAYEIVVRFENMDCETNGGLIDVIAGDLPNIVGVTFTNPSDCGVNDGTILIFAGSNSSVEYSIDGGMTWASENLFENLAPGMYNVFVRNVDGSCPIESNLNPLPLTEPNSGPSIDSILTSSPSACGANDGFIEIFASGMGVIEYSIDGGMTFQAGGVFTNLEPGTFDILVQFVGSGCTTSNTVVVTGLSICNDTIQVLLPFETSLEICLDANVFQVSGTITSADICSAGDVVTVEATAIDSVCVTLTPGGGFSGASPDVICVVHCFDNDPNLCDTTFILVSVMEDDLDCPEVFGVDTITIDYVGNPTPACVPMTLSQGIAFDIFLNNQPYNQPLMGCDQDSLIFYTYSFLFGGGFNGPYELISWVADGQILSGFFNDVEELVSLMNNFDPAGNWMLDLQTSTIIGGSVNGIYGDMNITHVISSTSSLLMTNFSIFSNGTVIQIENMGINELIVEDPDTGCRDTLYINAVGNVPQTDTIFVTTTINTTSEEICVTGEDLPTGFINSLGICGLPDNGTVIFVQDSCVTYTPTFNFLGKDTFCLLACDNNIPATCDSTIIIVCVEIPMDTLILEIAPDLPVDTCLTDFLQLPGNIISAETCSIEDTEMSISFTGDCVTIDPVDGFIGTSEVCVVHCDDSDPQFCDTTILIINIPDPCADIIPIGNITVESNADPVEICIPIPLTQAMDLNIFLDGMPYTDPLVPCVPEPPFAAGTAISVNGIGIYQLIASDTSIVCTDTLTIIVNEDSVICDPIFLVDTLLLESPDSLADFCMAIPFVNAPIYTITVDGVVYSGNIASCDNQQGTQITLNGLGFHSVVVADTMGCIDSVIVEIMEEVIICDPIFATDTVTLESPDGMADFCMAIPFVNAPIYEITVDGLTYTGNILSCNNQQGIQITLDGLGFHSILVEDTLGCVDSVIVEIIEEMIPPNNMDTLFFTTPQNTPTDTICLMADDLSDPIDLIAFCDLPNNGTAPVVMGSDSCLTYIPAPVFIGNDSFCVVLCDGNVPPNCDTVFVIVSVLPPVDTIVIDALNVEPFDTCLDASILQLPSDLVGVDVCGINLNEVTLNLVDNCITIDLANDFEGTTTACVIHCDDSNPPICDTTILIINSASPCDPLFSQDSLIIISDIPDGEVCLPIPVIEINNYDIFVDGLPYNQPAMGCDFDSVYIYSYSLVQGQGQNGPYEIMWTVDGMLFLDTVQNVTELIDSMNVWNPAGNWMDMNLTILSQNDGGNYGQLVFNHLPTMITTTVQANLIGLPMGTAVTIEGYGTHDLVVESLQTGCTDTLIVIIIDPNDTLNIVTFENTPSQSFCLDTLNLPGNFDTLLVCDIPNNGMLLIENNCFVYFPNQGYLGMDNACVVVCDDLGNCDTTYLFIDVIPICFGFDLFIEDSLQVQAIDCSLPADICLPILLDSLNNYAILDNGVPYSGSTIPCETDSTLIQIQLDTGFHEIVFIELASGCSDSLIIEVTCEVMDNSCGINALSPELIQAADCDTQEQFCIDVTIFDISDFIITDNGQLFSGNVTTCIADPQFAALELDTGFHQLILVDTVKNCTDTFNVLVNCMMIEDIVIDTLVHLDEQLVICLEDLGLQPTLIDSLVNTCIDQSTGNVNFIVDETNWCITLDPQALGLDTACFKVYFADTCLTVFINVEVIAPCVDLLDQEVIGMGIEDCSLNSGDLCLPVPLIAMQNVAIQINGQPYTGNIQGCDFDSTFSITYSVLPSNGLIGPYEMVSWTVNGVLFEMDTFNTALELVDLMNMYDPIGNWTYVPPSTIIGGNGANTYSPMEFKQILTQAPATLGVTSQFIPRGTQITLPIGTFEITFQDTLTGCTDTIQATLACLESDIFMDTVLVGMIDTLCLDTFELPGNLTSITNICEGNSGEFVLFEIIDPNCVAYLGMEPGVDTACIILCDDLGVCDTTTMIITTIAEDEMPPIAVNDTISTGQDQPIRIDILLNDTVNFITNLEVLTEPMNGEVFFLPDNSINYVPEVGYCDSANPDSFTYQVCNPIGCDTATVFVTIECIATELIIYNGFSPNNDGFNDFFVIEGLNLFEGHILKIYNRWGNLVFESTNYLNDWAGTWENENLPDGTYFYVLDIVGEGIREGYLQINR